MRSQKHGNVANDGRTYTRSHASRVDNVNLAVPIREPVVDLQLVSKLLANSTMLLLRLLVCTYGVRSIMSTDSRPPLR